MPYTQKTLSLSRSKYTSLLLISVILSLTITAYPNPKSVSNLINPSQNPVANSSSDKGELLLGKAIEQELVGDGAHSYTLKLEANQYLNLVVEQKGIDIVATVFNPSGEKVYEVDSPNGTEGPEPIYLISQSSGNYRLEVRSLEKGAKAGKYEAKLVELRASKPTDIDRVDAFKALGEAVLLGGEEGKSENAIEKYQEAIEKFGKASELITQATVLNSLGEIYYNKKNYSKAEPLYIQSLEIRRKILGDNHPDTAISLNNLAEIYSSKGDYAKAESLHIQSLEISRKILGDNHIDTANSLNNLALLYDKKGDYAKAESLHIQSLEIRRKIFGDSHPSTAFSLNNLAALYYKKGDYSKAEPFFIEVLDIFRKSFGDKHSNTTTALNNLAELYSSKGDYAKAESLLIQVSDILRKVHDDIHPDIGRSFNNLAALYLRKGDYAKAESLAIQAVDVFRKTLGDNHPSTAVSINTLAEIYSSKWDFTKAEPLYLQTIDIFRKTLGDNHPDTALSINNLAGFYYQKGDFAKVETLLSQALDIRKKTLGDNHPGTALSINNLANFYDNKGDYAKAEPLYLQALDIHRKTLGDNHPDTAASINNLATLYDDKGDYSKAEPLYLQALDIYRKTFGNNHPDTAQSINNLALLYDKKKDYAKAEPLLIQALDIYRKVLGDNHPSTALSISNLAEFYSSRADYTKAEPFHLQALDIRRKTLGDNHPDTANSINNLASLYDDKGDYSKAEPLYLQAIDTHRKALGDNHPNTILFINNLAQLYSRKGDYKQVVKYSQEANDLREIALTRNLALGSERQKQLYLQLYANETDIALSLHVQSAPTNPLAKQLALTQILRRKGRSIDAVNQSVEALRKRSKPEDVALLDELAGKKALFSNLSIQGLGKRSLEEYQKEIKSLQDEIEKLEYKISERSAEFRTQLQPITLQAVQQAVPSDSTLVEFASYRPFDSKTRKYAESRYVVYLLNNQGEIDWVDLGEAEAIDELVVELRTKLRNSRSSVFKEIKPLSRKLDKLVMEPVRKLAGKEKRLLIAPDGTLNLVPFAALVDENGKFLLENNSISYLTSGRDLLRLQIKIDSKQPPVILADPDFGVVAQKSTEASAPKEGETIFASLKFNRLEATVLEAKAIKTLFPNAELLLQKQASEEALTKLNAPSILHIATHGFFLQERSAPVPPTPDEQRLATFEGTGRTTLLNIKVENPLLRSGLALSGANLRTDDKEQGIFTALKTTGLNLWGTKVVVLSACDTGVGEVKTGDGIYGLRRALVLAGSETQLMSLWPISDNGTKELMLDYYSRLQKGEGRSDALRQTQLSLLKSKTRQHPYFWASFIQSGEWANLDGRR